MKPFISHDLESQLSPIDVDTNKIRATIGMLSSIDLSSPLMLSLKHIEEFVAEHTTLLIQRGLGIGHEISDYNFTEYGADIMEDELPIIALSNIVLKYEPFTFEQIFFLREKGIILSTAPPESFTHEMVQLLHEKKITAVGVNFLNIDSSEIQNTVNHLVSMLISSKKVLKTKVVMLKY